MVRIRTYKSILATLTSLSPVRLPKIKAWVDEHNPGDLIIPFSVALEERLVQMSDEERDEEEKKIGATSALPKITKAGYSGLDVRCPSGSHRELH